MSVRFDSFQRIAASVAASVFFASLMISAAIPVLPIA